MSRFADLSESDIQQLLEGKDAKKTSDIIRSSVKTFTEYCVQKDLQNILSMDLKNEDELARLNETLKSFYAEIRQVNLPSFFVVAFFLF